jgi:hypothetical protein
VYGDSSPDVAAYFGNNSRFASARWHFDWKSVGFFPVGSHTLHVVAKSTLGTSSTFQWPLGQHPYGAIDVHAGPGGFVVGEPVEVAGWAVDAGRTFDSGVDEISIAVIGPRWYTVKVGDTLWEIARTTTGDAERWTEIARANGLSDQRALRAGQRLLVNATDEGLVEVAHAVPAKLGLATLGLESHGVVDLMVDPLFGAGGYRFVVDTTDFAEGEHWLQATVHARTGGTTLLQRRVELWATAARAKIDAATPHGALLYKIGLDKARGPYDVVRVAHGAELRYQGDRLDLTALKDGVAPGTRELRFEISSRVNARFVGALEFSVEPGSRPDFRWTLTQGESGFYIVVSGKSETMSVGDSIRPGIYSPQIPIPKLASGRRVMLSVVSNLNRLVIREDGASVFDVAFDRADAHGSPEIGVSGDAGTIHIYSLRIYSLPCDIDPTAIC